MTSSLILRGHDIEPYLPRTFSDDAKERVYDLASTIADRIDAGLAVPFRYSGRARIMAPASLYLQDSTPRAGNTITHPVKGYPWQLRVYKHGARQTVGVDAREVYREGKLSGWWKSFHLDRVDDLRLLDNDELEGIFRTKLKVQSVTDEIMSPHYSHNDFVRNWNHHFRTFLAQSPSHLDLLQQ